MSGIRVGLAFLTAATLLGSLRSGQAQDLAFDSVRERRIQSAVTRICQDAWERFAKGEYRRAETGFRKAGLYRPHDWSLKLDLAHALLGRGDYDYAAYAIRRALDLHPDPASLDYDLRSVFPSEERYQRTRDRLLEFVDQHPLNRDGQFSWGYFSLFSGDEDEALRAFEQVLDIDPKDRYARLFGERLAIREFHGSDSTRELGPSGPRHGEDVPEGVVWNDRPGPAETYRIALTGGGTESASEASEPPGTRSSPAGSSLEPDAPAARPDAMEEDTGEENGGLEDLEARPVAPAALPAQGRRAEVQPARRPALPGRPRLTDR